MTVRSRPPNLSVERSYWDAGVEWVVGVDEVGRGSWAGPLTIGVAVVPRDRRVNRIRDSKQLTERAREQMFQRVADWCIAWAVGHASPEECDGLGMSEAQRLATRRAFARLDLDPEVALVDGNWDFVAGGPTGRTRTRKIIRGDATSLSIASASILAKVTRDRIMRDAAEHFPAYSFEANKGYPCPRHKTALQGYGPSSIHRRSWVFMDGLVWDGLHRPVPEGQPEPESVG
ncbi:MAG: ribonuclease HII [Acidimicrobiales bacterium]